MKQAQQQQNALSSLVVSSSGGKENLNGLIGKKTPTTCYFYDPSMNLQQSSKTLISNFENRPYIRIIYGGNYQKISCPLLNSFLSNFSL